MRPPVAIMAVDIGGTKTKAGAVECESPNTKSQSSNNHQTSITKPQTVWSFSHWNVELVWCLRFGHWLFQLRRKPTTSSTGERMWAALEIPTPHVDPALFYEAIARLVREVRAEAERACLPKPGRRRQEGVTVLPLVAVAHPGRFLPDGSLARGTTPNLGAAPGQFDGVRPAGELSRRLNPSTWPTAQAAGRRSGFRPMDKSVGLHVTVIAENDAIAQMRFGLHALLQEAVSRERLIDETVVYLGPGTGMGGGVARVDTDGAVTPVTDGHFFDLQVAGCHDGTLTAEELFTGPSLARAVVAANATLAVPIHPARPGGLDEVLLDPGSLPEHRAEAECLAAAHGEILAALIMTIHAGAITKVRLEQAAGGAIIRHVDEPDRAWSAADRAVVRGAKRFILGGFIGTSKGLGPLVRNRALEVLRRRGLSDVEIFQIPVDSADAGLLGAAQAIPADLIRHHLLQTPITK